MKYFCTECGSSLPEETIMCPKCGALVDKRPVEEVTTTSKNTFPDRYSTPQPTRKKKSIVKKWGHLSWVFLLIGAAIGIYALFTPAGSINLEGLISWDMWMFGYNKIYDWETGWDIFWIGNEDLFAISLGSTIFVVIGNVLAIVAAGFQIKRRIYKSYLPILAPIVAVIATLVYLAGFEINFYMYLGESFWSVLPPAFAVFGQFLAAPFMIIGFFIARSASKSKVVEKNYDSQEQFYLMLKMISESKSVPQEKKDKLRSELKVLELRFNAIYLLQKKIDWDFTKKVNLNYLESEELGKALGYFQQAVELSSSHTINFSQRDLELASKLILENDKKNALYYLNEIKSHTDYFLAELLINLRKSPTSTSEWKQKTTPSQNTSHYTPRFPPISELMKKSSLNADQGIQQDCPKCALSRKINLSRCSWCGKVF